MNTTGLAFMLAILEIAALLTVAGLWIAGVAVLSAFALLLLVGMGASD